MTALYVTHVGKESNRLEEAEAGLIHDPEEVYTAYVDPAHDPWHTLVLPVLKQMPRSLIQQQTGLSRTLVTAVRTGHAMPRPAARETLLRVAAEYARAQLRSFAQAYPGENLAACAAYLQTTLQ